MSCCLNRSYLLDLSKKAYLSPSDSLLEDCSLFLSQIESDLHFLRTLNLDSVPIHYHHSSIFLSEELLSSLPSEEQENLEILENLTKSYVFTNIKEK